MRQVSLVSLVLGLVFMATSAFADIAIDPCEGMMEGDPCTTDSGAEGTCVEPDQGIGTLVCTEAAATNNATNNATNSSDDGSSSSETEEDGCAVTGLSGRNARLWSPLLLGLALRREATNEETCEHH